MDIQHLIDRLEDLVDEGRHIPLSRFTMIDEERALELIDQMRISIPEEIDKAQRIMNQRDRLLAQANEEAARVVDLAHEKTATLVDRDAVTQAAKNQATNISSDADTYVLEVLDELESQLVRTLTVVRNGISKVTQECEEARARAHASIEEALVAETSIQPEPEGSGFPTAEASSTQ
jgi:cell division septum initiation protein DivIVA